MKKKAILLSTLLFILLLAIGSCLFFLPYLTDAYLSPSITKNLPFSDKTIRILRISPWNLQGTIRLGNNGQDILTIPGIEFNFSPQSILKGKIDSILIDGATLRLNLDSLNSGKSAASSQPFLLPVSCNTVIIKNSSIIINRGQKEHYFSVNGRLTGNYTELGSWQKELSSAHAEVQVTGASTLAVTINLQQRNAGYELVFSASAPDISQITSFSPKLIKINTGGRLTLSGHLEADSRAELKQIYAATAEISNTPPAKPLVITIKGDRETLSAELQNLSVSAPLQSSIDIHGNYNLKTNRFTGKGKAIVETDRIPVDFSFSGQKTISATELSLTTSVDSFTSGKTSPLITDLLTAQSNLTITDGNISGNLNGSVARLAWPSQKTILEGITFSLPLQIPINNSNALNGKLSVNTISYDGVPSGSIKGSMTINSEKASFSTEITSRFGPDLRVQCDGYFSLDRKGEVNCNLARTHIDSIFFPPFVTLPPEFSVDGYLSAQTRLSYSERITDGNLQLQFENGTINISDNQLSSVNIGITLPDFPLLHSDSGQLCTIGSIQLGKIKLSNAKINFRLEDFQSIFIEKSAFTWCDGKVESSSFRLSAGERHIATTLYCDRLKFTKLLHQFGIENAEGEGALNGKLPLSFSKNGIEFDDGFLFSTPGDTGIVHFNNTASLRQGIGAIDQTPYLDYSMQALENFSYNWTKLTFNSQEEDLLIKMQIDGKPAVALPFGYKKGHIVPTEKGQGLQHPIRLDVNFRLPFTDLFQYGKNMQSLMENR